MSANHIWCICPELVCGTFWPQYQRLVFFIQSRKRHEYIKSIRQRRHGLSSVDWMRYEKNSEN